MFCLGERDTLLVTYIRGLFLKDTLLCREKASNVGGGVPERSCDGDSSRLKIVSEGCAAGAFPPGASLSLRAFTVLSLTLTRRLGVESVPIGLRPEE